MEQAAAAMRVLGDQLAREYPLTNGRFGAIEVFGAGGIGLYRGVGQALLPVFTFIGFLSVVAGFILFVNCANLAGLLLARAAALGVCGLIAYIVAQRSREVAIRRAVGAPTRHIVRIVVGSSIGLAGAGLLLGLAAGSLTAPLLGGLLVDVSPRDPMAPT